MSLSEDPVSVVFGETCVPVPKGASLLESMEQQGLAVPSSCRAGICQSCMMQTTDGNPPKASQKGLKPTLQDQGYFLACICYPDSEFSYALAQDAFTTFAAKIAHIDALSADVVRVQIPIPPDFKFKAGQFINLRRKDGLTRSYSIASLPDDGPFLDIHVRRIPEGRMSCWIHDTLSPDDTIEVRGPHGDCFYLNDNSDQEIVLIGTGTGTAPLYAIARDALESGHRGPIRLFQGGFDSSRIYFEHELRSLDEQYPNFSYIQCLYQGEGRQDSFIRIGNIEHIVDSELSGNTKARVYLCGDPTMVANLRKKFFLKGYSLNRIHSDAFVNASS